MVCNFQHSFQHSCVERWSSSLERQYGLAWLHPSLTSMIAGSSTSRMSTARLNCVCIEVPMHYPSCTWHDQLASEFCIISGRKRFCVTPRIVHTSVEINHTTIRVRVTCRDRESHVWRQTSELISQVSSSEYCCCNTATCVCLRRVRSGAIAKHCTASLFVKGFTGQPILLYYHVCFFFCITAFTLGSEISKKCP